MTIKHLTPLLAAFILSCSSPNQPAETSPNLPGNEPHSWKEAVIYQIYPRSFKDSDGDGVGDLRGIINQLDYIKSLGITMVWINPFYASPNADNGYDISDYRAIQPEFGNMKDFDDLLKGLHERDIKFVMDLVVNHSSDEHEWFQQSRSSRDNPYRDYYHWWPAEKGKPNYRWSFFDPKGEAWKYDSLTDAYYLHYFAQKQPDLNWENPKVRQEVYDIMKFWANKGVDGFRLDAFQFISKDTTFPPLPEGYEKNVIKYYGMGPNIHPYIKEMHDEVLSKYNVFAVSEGAGSSFEDAHALVDKDRDELQMAYHFEAVDMVRDLSGYTLDTFKEIHSRWDSAFTEKGWLSVFLANHDKARMVDRFGNPSPQFRAPSIKLLNTFILSMRGTPYCYYGDEIGMTNISFDSIEQYQDIAAINGYKKVVTEGGDIEQYMAELKFLSRDNGRTPMQWDASENAGFTSGTPWLPVNSNYREINVANQSSASNSCLNHFKEMVKLRLNTPSLIYGAYQIIQPNHETIYAYTRSYEGEEYLVVLNFSKKQSSIQLEGFDLNTVSINNYEVLNISDKNLTLEPYQAIIFKTR
ncbi:glycoside hydrolase family 13 protein [Marinoscillum pacificum]|uniref:glycoside hydrolase family 13 protein n=1 Tax=Marinoscillum pacificum TaxID=392723 RepID=UPI0021578D4C|nr:alpha-glucosidase [Marinoscillum pacificum]